MRNMKKCITKPSLVRSLWQGGKKWLVVTCAPSELEPDVTKVRDSKRLVKERQLFVERSHNEPDGTSRSKTEKQLERARDRQRISRRARRVASSVAKSLCHCVGSIAAKELWEKLGVERKSLVCGALLKSIWDEINRGMGDACEVSEDIERLFTRFFRAIFAHFGSLFSHESDMIQIGGRGAITMLRLNSNDEIMYYSKR